MNSFDFYSPTYFVFGLDRESETAKYVRRYGGSRVMIVYGGHSAKKSGLLDRIEQSLTDAGLYYTELGGIKPNPRSGLVYDGIELARREKVDFLLAVGGGSVIDTAKSIAMGVPYEGDFWDFFSGKTPEVSLPVGTVLTIAASGSEGSPNAIITNEKTLAKTAAEADCIRPKFSIMDPALTQSLPPPPDRLRRHRYHLPRLRAVFHQHLGRGDHRPAAGGRRPRGDARGTPRP